MENRIERIVRMERYLDNAAKAVKELDEAIDRYIEIQAELKALESYYTSPMWREDYDADCSGQIPDDLKRGVLSQDAVYDLLCENRQLLEKSGNLLRSGSFS